jgi:2-polyprenyl-6-methoxyphenol hydroxylase-like FAD-dependent oxidoreductase
MAVEEVHDIVIVGGGIGGLALSLGLHRSIVFL